MKQKLVIMKFPWFKQKANLNELESLDIEQLTQQKQEDVIISMWKVYNQTSHTLSQLLGRTKNIVGEYAEFLVAQYVDGELLSPSNRSADIRGKDGKTYQVKSRKVTSLLTQLNVIRTWDFDFLVVVLFNFKGEVVKAIKMDSENAKNNSVYNKHQNGWVITTNSNFFNQNGIVDITADISKLNLDEEPILNPINKRIKKTLESYNPNSDGGIKKINPRVSKFDALQMLMLNHKHINKKNTTFSSPNKATGNWWLEPEINKFKEDLYIILLDDKNSKLYVFHIPANSIVVPEKQFYFRENKNAVSINIPYTENDIFIDSHTDFSFNRYLVDTVPI